MKKNIKIDSKTSITVSSNVNWLYIYRDQFGRDIVPALIPVLNAGLDLIIGSVEQQSGGLKGENIRDAIFEIAGFEMTDLLNIIWAMAKNADDNIADPREWYGQFDKFPMDAVLLEVLLVLVDSMVSSKNAKRLKSVIETLKAKGTN